MSRGSGAACANCGYTGAPFGPGDDPGPREPQSTFAGARAKLATATQDLFRLSGNNSIPVEAEVSAPPPPAPPPPVEDPTSGRKPEASIMFSLEELMKANSAQSPTPSKGDDEAPEQLWSMSSATPLFGTEYDQALLTTPLKREQTSMDSMTVPSRRPPARRLVPLLLAIAGGSAALAGVGWWAFGPTESEASPSAEVAAVEPAVAPEPLAEAAPAAGSESAAAAEAPPPTEAAPAAPEKEAEATPAEAAPSAANDAPDEEADEEEAPSGAKVKKKKKASSSKRTSERASAPSSAKAPFNTSAAKNALTAAAARAAGCKGTSGTGKVQLTFATSGRVSSAQLVAGPFGGTASGKCALRHFKAAKIPAFSGSPQSVAKSFKIP